VGILVSALPTWLALLLCYVVGSFPSAWIAGKLGGVDLRAHGSGNLGATNVLRVLGPRLGVTVLLADIAKGALPVLFLAPLTGSAGQTLSLLEILCGAAAILGHSRPVFLGFRKGGKGVATACGVFLAVAPIYTMLAIVTFAIVVGASGIVSLASLSAAAAFPIYLAAGNGFLSFILPVGAVASAFVFWTHRANIGRLRAGTEFRFERSAKLSVASSLVLGAVVVASATTWLMMRTR